ncbi:MAG: type II toxin-antitoxin system RelE/ParE family toxin [Bacteroidia bacterium]|nr:type II toxin-antitoxin system RelE/ParE family toxin [Bacteroidia bacterium]MCF8425116.1 type II toxin-antitoxin system RelE/ParE family toxin [Bacteroidia bacterium]MCF8446663.1 type II toxin-antitoxin system RelE/ParE family toxin [Bacteroidia bacterium]
MAKRKVVWSLLAKNNRIQILDYWIERNKSKDYSIKINNLFKEGIEFISEFPEVGKLTDDKSARIIIVRDYLIVYESNKDQILILTIFDGRQDPIKLKY